jgi:hypothetical protein
MRRALHDTHPTVGEALLEDDHRALRRPRTRHARRIHVGRPMRARYERQAMVVVGVVLQIDCDTRCATHGGQLG